MNAKQISKLRARIQETDYVVKRWKAMWRESDLWYQDYRCFKKRWMLQTSIMYRRKAEWYSNKMQ